jgi:FMN phosphatase YigB (HAD superfamily)
MARIKNIIVDLDGTLIDFDSSFKMWKSLFRLNFFPLLKVLFIYIVYGEARAKSSFHKISNLNYTLNQNLLQYLYKMKQVRQ